jgi:hypothetical protein
MAPGRLSHADVLIPLLIMRITGDLKSSICECRSSYDHLWWSGESDLFRGGRMLKLLGYALILFASALVLAQDVTAWVLFGNGTVYINGQQMTNSTAVMANDVIQTKDAGVAHLVGPGSSAMIQSNTIVRFESGGIALDRGTLSMATGKGSSVLARDFKISPASSSWTQYDVIRATGSVQIFARKGNITVSCGTGAPTTVKEGQQISRLDASNCGLADKRGGGAPPAAQGPIITSATVEKGVAAAGAALAGWAVFQSDNPVSPSAP